jgi:hypothetical protein
MNRTWSRRSLCRSAVAGLGAAALGAGCRTTAPVPVPGPDDGAEPDPTRGYLGRVRDGVLAWLETVRWKPDGWGRWKYNAHMVRDCGLQSSAQAVGILDRLGALPPAVDPRRGEAVRFYQSCQDPKDGWFKDPRVTPEDRVGDRHSWEHIWAQMSSIACALRRLGSEPLHPMPKARFIDVFSIPPAAWHGQFDWKNPGLVGEEWARAVQGFWEALPVAERRPSHPAIRDTFESMEAAILDPETGMPTRGGCADPSVAMAGLFNLASAYRDVGRPLPYAERAVDTVLALQRPSGEFGGWSEMGLNGGALGLLRLLDRQVVGSHRHADIAAAGNRCAAALLASYRKPDGGFARDRDRCIAEHNSIRVSQPLPEGDTLGTETSLECLAYADAWNAPPT